MDKNIGIAIRVVDIIYRKVLSYAKYEVGVT